MTVRSWVLGLWAAFALGLPVQAATLELKNVAAEVTVIPEDRADVAVTVVRTNPRLPLYVRNGLGGSVVVEGQRRRLFWPPFFGVSITSCPGAELRSTARAWGLAPTSADRLPKLVVRAPRSLRIRSGGAIVGAVGRSDDLDLTTAGCDRWTVGNVRGDLHVRNLGSGEVQTGSAGRAEAMIAGSGGIALGPVANGLSAAILGSGDITAAAASGPVKAEIAGSGDIRVGDGHATIVRAKIGGSGDIRYNGRADALDAGVAGSGDVSVARVDGPVHKSIAGSGDVRIGP
jgi:hypothetical protein